MQLVKPCILVQKMQLNRWRFVAIFFKVYFELKYPGFLFVEPILVGSSLDV